MCPDIETFAPLIQATFGAAVAPAPQPQTATATGTTTEDPPAPDLRVRLADRALHQSNPVLGTLSRLLALADGRLTASDVLDLADREPVRRRFGFDDDDIVHLETWITTAGARWGLDADHRAPYKLDGVTQNTWRSALDRILLGVTMTEDDHRLVGEVLPLDDVDSGAIDLAGRFAELIDRLALVVDRFATARTLTDWTTQLAHAADLLTATSAADAWQRTELDRVLAAVTTAAAGHDDATTLTLPEVRELLKERLAGRATRANFRTGHLTFCTLMPMRSVPHRVVCLLGLDDEVFPRKAPRDGDDLIISDPHVGDHDGRTEDRQLLLDALMSAQDRLVITYSGNDERTNAQRPPAVPVGELLDVIDRTVRTDDGKDAREHLVVHHPLQPFDPRAFVSGGLRAGTPFSYDGSSLRGAQALTGPDRGPRPPFLDRTGLPPLPTEDVPLDDLVRFVNHPAKAFLRRRLQVSLFERDDELPDDLPVELDALQKWAVGDRLLQGRLRGLPLTVVHAAEQARGELPIGKLATNALSTIHETVEAIVAAVTDVDPDHAQPSRSLDARVRLPDGRLIHGTVAGIRPDDVVQQVVYSSLAAKHRLNAWVRLLVLTAARPETPWRARSIGKRRSGGSRGTTVTVAEIPPLGATPEERQATALRHLETLVDLWDRSMREVPPLATKTSAAWADAVLKGGSPVTKATREWESDWDYPKEDKDPAHLLLLRGQHPFEALLVRAPRDDEKGEGWDEDQPHRFGRWALRLWSGLHDAGEDVQDR